MKKNYLLLSLGVFLLAVFFRFYGVNWDQNQHLHPDERFLTMVTIGISWPENIWEYLDTDTSPLNPHNRGFGFFVYGTFPIFFTKWVAESFKAGNYNDLTLLGRRLSAIFDLGTTVLVFVIAKTIISKSKFLNSKQIQKSNNKKLKQKIGLENLSLNNWNLFRASDFGFWIFPLLAMFFYAISVLPIQLSHFYAVDTYLTFFITLSFYFLTKIVSYAYQNSILNSKFLILNSLLGISFGLALASKISAVLFLPIILLSLILKSIMSIKNSQSVKEKISSFLSVFFVFCFLFFVFSPSA